MGKAAIFWDRDNTLMVDSGYVGHPDKVALLPGAGGAVRRLAEAGFENVVVTNQSGIARGLLDEPMLARIHDRFRQLMAGDGATIEAIYYCPYLEGEEAVVESYRQASDLRKPKPGMLVKASLERNLDLAASWMIGNSLCDTQAGRAAGCRTVLLTSGARVDSDPGQDQSVDFVAASLDEAVEIVLKHTCSARTPGAVATPGHAEGEGVAATAQELLRFLRMVDRRSQREDFSLARLAGTVVQIMALAVLLWATFGWFFGPPNEPIGAHLVRMLLGIFLQLIALTFLVISSRK